MIFDWKCSIYEFRRDKPSVSLLRSIFTWSYFWGTSFARHWSIWRKNIEKEVTWFETSIWNVSLFLPATNSDDSYLPRSAPPSWPTTRGSALALVVRGLVLVAHAPAVAVLEQTGFVAVAGTLLTPGAELGVRAPVSRKKQRNNFLVCPSRNKHISLGISNSDIVFNTSHFVLTRDMPNFFQKPVSIIRHAVPLNQIGIHKITLTLTVNLE